eukprot:g10715.t1
MSLAEVFFGGVLAPVAALWSLASRPSLTLLRAANVCPPPVNLLAAKEDLSGRVMIVTGANTGIGKRTAYNLARMGAKVIMACRSPERGEKARQELEQEMRELSSSEGNASGREYGTLEVMQCDLSELESVRSFAREFKAKHGNKLDVLVNNAGVGITDGYQLTVDGLDFVFGVNFVGHFELTMKLMPLIEATPAARVVCLSSVMHHGGGTDWESSIVGNSNRRGSTYGDSKLAMVLFAKELRRRFAASGSSATAFSVNPGAVRSDIWRHVPKFVMPVFDFLMRMFFVNTEQGCCTSVCASSWPLERLSGGDYYQPYWMPFGCPWPCELMGPFVGCAPGPAVIVYTACATPCLALLRRFRKCPPAPSLPDEDLSARVVIVTGANTGIGSRTAFHLARMGAKVIMACRSVERGEAARAKLQQELATLSSAKTSSAVLPGTLEVMECDLCDFSSIRAFARAFKAKHGARLDVLVNNAGIAINDGPRLTVDGLDTVFGVNFVGHFVLTTELMPLITSTPNARVVCLSSVAHYMGGENWESASAGTLGRWAYPESKRAMVRLAKELNRRFTAAGSSASAFAVNPGAVRSDIYRNLPKLVFPAFDLLMRWFSLTTDQGCYPSVCTSTWPLERLSGSEYYQPYWVPFSFWQFFWGITGPFVGCAPGKPTLIHDEPAASSEFWTVCTRIVETADALRGNAAGAAAARG